MNVTLAPYGLEHELERELTYKGISFEKRDRLYFFHEDYQPLFAQVSWLRCQRITISSINDAIKKLRILGGYWSLYTICNHRRAQLIQDGLPTLKDASIPFLSPLPAHTMGGWTMLDYNTIICSTETTSRYSLGKVEFIENKSVPPSRAYVKLWELFTLHCKPPAPGTTVLDLGAAPGGWSWVLAQLECNVIAIDKAPLAQNIAGLLQIKSIQQSAFSINPGEVSNASWLFSDIICYPERLLTLIERWLQESNVTNFVCTIKFQGEVDFSIIDQFIKIPNSRVVHLYHNKHELMWWK